MYATSDALHSFLYTYGHLMRDCILCAQDRNKFESETASTLGFIRHVAKPAYAVLSESFPEAGHLLQNIEQNELFWQQLVS